MISIKTALRLWMWLLASPKGHRQSRHLFWESIGATNFDSQSPWGWVEEDFYWSGNRKRWERFLYWEETDEDGETFGCEGTYDDYRFALDQGTVNTKFLKGQPMPR